MADDPQPIEDEDEGAAKAGPQGRGWLRSPIRSGPVPTTEEESPVTICEVFTTQTLNRRASSPADRRAAGCSNAAGGSIGSGSKAPS